MCAKRWIALLLTACVLPVTTGCSMDLDQYFMEESSPESAANSVDRYDTEPVKAEIDALQEIWRYPDKESEISAAIERLLHIVDETYERYIRADLAYYLDWHNDDLDAQQLQAYKDYCVVSEMATWVFTNGYSKTGYSELFEPYADLDWLTYYNTTTLSRVMANARQDAGSSDERLSEYYDVAYEGDTDTDETNLLCAQLYLDTLDEYETDDCMFETYCRDYTVEQARAAYEMILEELVPVWLALYDQLTEDERFVTLAEEGLKDEPYDLLKTHAPKLSPAIAESVEKLFAEELYSVAKGDDCYDGSYTVSLPLHPTAMMYTYLDDSVYDLFTVVHEFGHFHAERDEQTSVYLQVNCSDIAEVQSQGMEMLFTQFYGDIFGENAAYMELLSLYNIMDSVISGFAIGNFEFEVMQNRDSMDAEAVAALFEEYSEACQLDLELYEISHLYEQPGYYIGYGVSALAATELYAEMQDDPDAASARYAQFSEISALSGENRFCSAISACGFADPFSADTLHRMAETLQERIETLST